MSIYSKETQLEILKELEKWEFTTPSFKDRIKLKLQMFFALHMPLVTKRHKCAHCKKKFSWIGSESIIFHYHIALLDKYEVYEFCNYNHFLSFHTEVIPQKEPSKHKIIDDDVLEEYLSKKKE